MVGIIIILGGFLSKQLEKGTWIAACLLLATFAFEVASLVNISRDRCWVTSPDCEYKVNAGEIVARASRPLIVTDMNASLYNFLTILNDSHNDRASVVYFDKDLARIKRKIAQEKFSVVYFIHASDALAKEINVQFGSSARPLITDVTPLSPQIWEVKEQ